LTDLFSVFGILHHSLRTYFTATLSVGSGCSDKSSENSNSRANAFLFGDGWI